MVHFAGIFIRLRTKIIYKLSRRINVFMQIKKVLLRVCSVAVLEHSLVNGQLNVLIYAISVVRNCTVLARSQ